MANEKEINLRLCDIILCTIRWQKEARERRNKQKNKTDFFLFWLWMQNVWIAYADILLFIYMEYGSRLSYIVQYVSHSHDIFRLANQKILYLINMYMANGDAWALSSFPLILVSLLLLFVYFVHFEIDLLIACVVFVCLVTLMLAHFYDFWMLEMKNWMSFNIIIIF